MEYLTADEIHALHDRIVAHDARESVWWGDEDNPSASISVITESDAGLEDDENSPRPNRLRLKYTITDRQTNES